MWGGFGTSHPVPDLVWISQCTLRSFSAYWPFCFSNFLLSSIGQHKVYDKNLFHCFHVTKSLWLSHPLVIFIFYVTDKISEGESKKNYLYMFAVIVFSSRHQIQLICRKVLFSTRGRALGSCRTLKKKPYCLRQLSG